MASLPNPSDQSPIAFRCVEPYIDDLKILHDLYTDLEPMQLPEKTKEKLKENLLHVQEQAVYNMQIELEQASGNLALVVALIGNFNAGKSSAINSLLGSSICPVKVAPTTSSITRFRYADTPEIIKVSADGARESISQDVYYNSVAFHNGKKENCDFDYYYPFSAFRELVLIDTPGFADSSNRVNESVTYQAIDKADALIYVLDINMGTPTDSELKRLKELSIKKERPCLLILNKAESKPPKARERIRETIINELEGIFQEVYFYSAKRLLGQMIGITKVWNPLIEQLNIISLNHESWDFVLHCSRDPKVGTINMSFDGLSLPGSETFVDSRNKFLAYLEQLRMNKNSILKKRRAKEEANYQKNRKECLAELKGSIIDNSDCDSIKESHYKSILRDLNSLENDILAECERRIIGRLKYLFKVKKAKVRFIWNIDVWIIEMRNISPLISDDIARITSKLLEYLSSVNNRLGRPVLGDTWFNNRINSIKEIANKSWSSIKEGSRSDIEKHNKSSSTSENKSNAKCKELRKKASIIIERIPESYRYIISRPTEEIIINQVSILKDFETHTNQLANQVISKIESYEEKVALKD